jgi:ABC-type polysaccharide/polyol phosphate transport system ATPase subunit
MRFEHVMTDDIAIHVEHLHKAYGLPFELSWKSLANAFGRDKDAWISRRHLALKDVSFDVRRGELLGVIGRNGAGKSTLLRVLAGVTPPTRGALHLNGSVFPMIELNAGMSERLTGRENVMLLGTIMGLSKRYMQSRMNDIEEFCDLGGWFDKPVWQYSSGMPGRLGFAVAVYSDAEILLIDEVLAVGDLAFRNRCTEKMIELRDSGRTIVLVSHNLGAIAGMCTRTIMLDQGEVKFDSLPDIAVQHYKTFVDSLAAKKLKKRKIETLEVSVAPSFGLHGVAALNAHGAPCDEIRGDQKFSLVMDCEIPLEFSEGMLEVAIATEDAAVLVETRQLVYIEGPPTYRRIRATFPAGVPLREGRYILSMRLKNDFTGVDCITAHMPVSFGNRRVSSGIIVPPMETTVSTPQPESDSLPPLTNKSAPSARERTS